MAQAFAFNRSWDFLPSLDLICAVPSGSSSIHPEWLFLLEAACAIDVTKTSTDRAPNFQPEPAGVARMATVPSDAAKI
jgi:hypothetical protein